MDFGDCFGSENAGDEGIEDNDDVGQRGPNLECLRGVQTDGDHRDDAHKLQQALARQQVEKS